MGDTAVVYLTANIGLFDMPTGACNPITIPGIPPEALQIKFEMPFKITGASAIEDLNAADLNVSLFPNPSNGMSALNFTLPEVADQTEVAVYDMIGRKVETLYSGTLPTGSHSFDINTSSFQNGMYFVRIDFNNGEKTFSQKLMVAK